MKELFAAATSVFTLLMMFGAPPLRADPLSIVVDIAPTALIVTEITQGTEIQVTTLIPPDADPHDFALKPSHRQALARADFVVATAPGLAPINIQASNHNVIVLSDLPDVIHLNMRSGADLSETTTNPDPHLWLDPQNAVLWAHWIADELGKARPESAERLHQNAVLFQSNVAETSAQIDGMLADRAIRNAVDHDAFQYFEDRFGLRPMAAVRDGEDAPPGPRRLARAIELSSDADCLITVGVADEELAGILNLTQAIALDPFGVGKESYRQILTDMAQGYLDCAPVSR